MAPRCKNAAEVLPEELLAAIREKIGRGGCFLWIPAAGHLTRTRRNELVVELYAEGHSTAAIADRLFISQRTVFRILAKARKQRARTADDTAAQGRKTTEPITEQHNRAPSGPREV
jgi:DNA-binding CsgD family transcriptional regulator